MYCVNCGNEINNGDKFCGKCGYKVGQNEENSKSMKKNKTPIILGVLLALIMIIAVGFAIKVLVIDKKALYTATEIAGGSSNDNIIDQNYDSNYHLSFVSSDMNNFPFVRLYYKVVDNSGNVVNDFEIKNIELQERLSGGKYLSRQVRISEPLANRYGLNSSIAIDKSGSISDNDMGKIKYVVKTFAQMMNFTVGDNAEIVAFDTDVNVVCNYTNDYNKISVAVDGLEPNGQTALYDAIYSGVLHSSNFGGARCVIAFTDGADNQSYYSSRDVIEFACKQQVPVYIIGVGSGVAENELKNVANSTNGKYWYIDDLNDLGAIFAEIYNAEKSTYYIEYETSIVGNEKYDARDIDIVIDNGSSRVHSTDTINPVLPQRIGTDPDLSLEKKLELMKTIGEYSVDTDIDEMDTITLGSYEIDGVLENGYEDIEWILLDRNGRSVFLMSKIIIENYNYNLNGVDNLWENSDLRRFVNNECYNAWFKDDEKNRILTTNVMTRDGNGANRTTQDKIYVLNEDECRQYFGYEDTNGHNKRIATHITPFLKATRKNITVESKDVWYKGNSSFWLRDAATTPQNVKYVGLAGKLHPEGDTVLENDGIRPVLWVTY